MLYIWETFYLEMEGRIIDDDNRFFSSCYLFYVQNVVSAGEVVAPHNFATVEPHELHQWRSAALDKWTFIDTSKL
jgi:hypothetical protein